MTNFFFRQTLLFSFSLLVLAPHLSPGHALRPQRFHQASEPIRGLFGTSIGDVVWSGRYLWVGTENGVARLNPAQSSGLNSTDWVTFTELNGLGRGAVSALDAVGETVWVATLVDSVIAGQGVNQAGTGLSFSHDGGDSWHHIPNEFIFDPTKAGFERSPGTTILNACFDIAIDGEAVYAAFFAGSTVRSLDQGRTWEPFLPGGADEIVFFAEETEADSLRMVADSLASTNAAPDDIAQLRAAADSLASQAFLHRTFAVIAYEDTVWIGTSSGIAFTFDGGQHWQNAKVRLGAEGTPLPSHPAGNWVVALERQVLPDGTTAIWAGTNTTTSPGQTQAISVSRDLGQTWGHTGPTFAWDFAFTPNFVWAGTDQGLLASPDPTLPTDSERVWDAIEVVDGQPLTGTFVGLAAVDDVLWAGAEHGLGRSQDEGNTWRVIRDLVRTRTLDDRTFVSTG
ncbi:MAG: hypothetical protein OXI35_07310, partial [Gemmatimonadota bacterium]|nr:hypothetical protein [Gemmatimonadota bacterium]